MSSVPSVVPLITWRSVSRPPAMPCPVWACLNRTSRAPCVVVPQRLSCHRTPCEFLRRCATVCGSQMVADRRAYSRTIARLSRLSGRGGYQLLHQLQPAPLPGRASACAVPASQLRMRHAQHVVAEQTEQGCRGAPGALRSGVFCQCRDVGEVRLSDADLLATVLAIANRIARPIEGANSRLRTG